MSGRTIVAACLLAASLGCSSGSETLTAPEVTEIRILAAPSGTDTVFAQPAQALIAEVRDHGQLKSGFVVRFEALSPTDTARPYERTIAVSNLALPSYGTFASDTTNASGRVGALVVFGTLAGNGRIVVTCPELGLADTIPFTTLPGSARKLKMAAQDTALLVGGSYSIGAYATDYFGNRRSDVVSYAAGPNVAALDASGRVTVGATIGRGAVALQAGAARDSARFTVLPTGTIATLHYGASGVGSIATSKLDGSNLTLLAPAVTPAYPRISPSGDAIVFQQPEGSGFAIYTVTMAGVTRRLLSAAVMPTAKYPRFSADGQYIYFSGMAPGEQQTSIWRVKPDGSALTRITIVATPGDVQFSLSPDGTRIAYTGANGVAMLQLSTGAKTSLSVSGTFPEFSPDGTRVAYLNGAVWVLDLATLKTTGYAQYAVATDPGLSWLPGGTALLVRGFDGPLLVSTAGSVSLLPLRDYFQLAALP